MTVTVVTEGVIVDPVVMDGKVWLMEVGIVSLTIRFIFKKRTSVATVARPVNMVFPVTMLVILIVCHQR